MTRDDIAAALAPYGASLDHDSYICRDGRRLNVRLLVKRGRLSATFLANPLYTGPAVAASVARFVESYWYWTPRA